MDPLTFASRLLELAEKFSGSITSWLRTEKRNKQVGGVKDSPHRSAVGADIVWDSPVDYELASISATVLGLRIIRESDHDHIQPLNWKNVPPSKPLVPSVDRETLIQRTKGSLSKVRLSTDRMDRA